MGRINRESASGAVQFMTKNPDSVMSYVIPTTIQNTDEDGTRAFYKLKEGDKIDGTCIVDFEPQVLS